MGEIELSVYYRISKEITSGHHFPEYIQAKNKQNLIRKYQYITLRFFKNMWVEDKIQQNHRL